MIEEFLAAVFRAGEQGPELAVVAGEPDQVAVGDVHAWLYSRVPAAPG